MDMLELGGEIPTNRRSATDFRKIVILFPLSLQFAMNYLKTVPLIAAQCLGAHKMTDTPITHMPAPSQS
jgi:hypothetical protein